MKCFACEGNIEEDGEGGRFMIYPVCIPCSGELDKAQARIFAGEDGPCDLCFTYTPEMAAKKMEAVRAMSWERAREIMDGAIAKARAMPAQC